MHWASRKRYNDLWKTLVRAAYDNRNKPQTKRCSVKIVQMRRRKLDKDNLYSSCKPVLDALKYWKLIKDDSTEWIDLEVEQAIGKEKWTIIQIEEL